MGGNVYNKKNRWLAAVFLGLEHPSYAQLDICAGSAAASKISLCETI